MSIKCYRQCYRQMLVVYYFHTMCTLNKNFPRTHKNPYINTTVIKYLCSA